MSDNEINKRKLEHIKIVLEKNVEPGSKPFEKYRLPFKALPEISLEEIETETKFFGKKLSFPFVISSMTGGPDKGSVINRDLAIAAEHCQVALGVGSMRVTLTKPESLKSFKIRGLCPNIPLFANFGLVQLNYGYGANEINKVIDSIEADGIFLHANHLQEAIQPEGDTNFAGLLKKLEKILPKIERPVIIKEVGSGIDFETAKKLHEIGIKWIDVSGLGGTSWTAVEGHRRNDDLGEIFKNEGIPTDQALKECSKIKGLNLIAGGGLRTGLDISKAIAMGAKMATAAKPLLAPALKSPEASIEILEKLKKELQIAMFVAGCKDLQALEKIKLVEK